MAPRIPSIPTTYKGVAMRSRLEARWAAFFDAVGWSWVYEPADLNRYIPDFLLRFHRDLLVDVKPVLAIDDARKRCAEIQSTIGWAGEILVLGAVVPLAAHSMPCIGVLSVLDGPERLVASACLFRCISCDAISILAAEHGWACRACGAGLQDGNGHVGQTEPGEITALWLQAGNRVQWRPA